MPTERLQKILAQAGIASRRKAEELIQQGLVTVNGTVAKIGDKADFETDHIKVDGTRINKLEDPFYVVFNKPKGVISMMSDPEGRPTLADFLQKLKVRVNPIGRLDFNSEGLLLLTNDGALAEKIQKSDQFPRVYHVKIKGHITTEMIERLSRGVRLANKFVKPLSVRINDELNKKTKIEIVFLNAANVDVKAYFETKGFLVERITRTGIGHLTLHGLEPGRYRTVPKTKFEQLVEQPELGVQQLEARIEKEREILPRDKRLRNVDEFGKVIPREGTVSESSRSREGAAGGGMKIAVKAGRGDGESRAPRSFGGPKGAGRAPKRDDDAIVVRSGRSADGKAAPRPRAYSDSVDMPKFKKRERTGATRFGDRPRRDDDRGPRSGGFGDRPRSDSRGPRSDSRAPRAGGFGGPRSDSRGPRAGGFGAKRPDSRGPRVSTGPRAGGGRPIARTKRRES